MSLGGWGWADCSIIPTQTPLGVRVRDSIEQWRDKSLLLTFERTATYSHNPLRGGDWRGRRGYGHTEVLNREAANSSRLVLGKIRPRGWKTEFWIPTCLLLLDLSVLALLWWS